MGSVGTQRNTVSINTASSQTFNMGTEKDIDSAAFHRQSSGAYTASVGSIERNYTKFKESAIEMSIMPNKRRGQIESYTARYMVKGISNDWTYIDKEYKTLKDAKLGVRNRTKDALEDFKNGRY